MKDAAGLAWDACALLNLAATGRMAEILSSFPCPSCVVTRVRVHEVFYLRPLPEEDPQQQLLPVDFTPLLAAGLLQDVELDGTEQATFVALSAELDEGEALTSAMAVYRQLCVVTDDRLAIRLLGARSPPVPVCTTPEWVKHWADESHVPADLLREVLRRIQLCARYAPRRRHPLQDWWESHLLSP